MQNTTYNLTKKKNMKTQYYKDMKVKDLTSIDALILSIYYNLPAEKRKVSIIYKECLHVINQPRFMRDSIVDIRDLFVKQFETYNKEIESKILFSKYFSTVIMPQIKQPL